MPKIGYGSNKKTRHMMPSGHKAFLVHNANDVDLLLMHNHTFAAEISHAVSSRKRIEIIAKAKKLGVKVTNPKGKVTTDLRCLLVVIPLYDQLLQSRAYLPFDPYGPPSGALDEYMHEASDGAHFFLPRFEHADFVRDARSAELCDREGEVEGVGELDGAEVVAGGVDAEADVRGAGGDEGAAGCHHRGVPMEIIPGTEPPATVHPALSISDTFRRLTAIAAGIDVNHADPDSPDGWLQAPAIFRVRDGFPRAGAETTDAYFEYSDRQVSVLHLVYALLTYGMQPNAMALDLLKKLLVHDNVRDPMGIFFRMKGRPVNDEDLILQLKQGYNWEQVVDTLFGEPEFVMELRDWGKQYFTGLLIPMVAARGPPSSHGSETANKAQAVLREQCLKRDGHMTVVGRVWNRFWPKDVVPPPRTELWDYGRIKACQIIPNNSPYIPDLRDLLVQFSGDPLIADAIDNATNAFMLTPQFHSSFRRFEWSIEACPSGWDDDYNYIFRKFSPYLPTALNYHADGEKVFFGRKDRSIPSPNPQLFNVYTALAKVANASGAAEVIDMILRDEEEIIERGRTGRTWGRVGQNYLVRQLERLSMRDRHVEG
ncbi:60S ribosomal protein L32 [Drechslerella dactyloides]|uniref:60S ribosomal protein L32 n=1 Tax=Drechslerella dactyloides TaxID=74499 RepID=A0AAD6J1M6_DREDA|nr:60S ribosomal protein L32 [Drechslerella dactyloides]